METDHLPEHHRKKTRGALDVRGNFSVSRLGDKGESLTQSEGSIKGRLGVDRNHLPAL